MKAPSHKSSSLQTNANAYVVGQRKEGQNGVSMKDNRPEALAQRKLIGAIQKMDEPIQKNETGMPNEVKTKMEGAMNTDFSDVKVHSNSRKAPEVGALAFTQGSQVHFAPGQFKPNTKSGQELLGHELAHVVQQRKGIVKPTTEAAGLPVNDSPHFEREADQLGKKAANFK
jgi:hypothetical protein